MVTKVVSITATEHTVKGTRNVADSGVPNCNFNPKYDHEPEEQRAGVAHVDLGGVEVVAQEPHRAARHTQRQTGHQKLVVGRGDGEERCCGDGGEASRQSVHVVQQVEGVGDANHPHDGDRCVQPADAGEAHPHTQFPYCPSGADLSGQTQQGRQVAQVVQQTQHGQAHGYG
jgi:hypothetical protein